ncbi:MAG: glycosyltransferase family 2 protein [Phycisphaerales bacterium]|nr:glycosyltransferase family 2 protein [Phycisphaerales bacterium]
MATADDSGSAAPLPLSVAVICKNNHSTIERTIDSVRPIASQIVALDSGSSDGTIEILESRGVEVHRVDWPGHIAQKNRALDACTQPWTLSIDSDESLEPDLARSVGDAITRDDPTVVGYEVNRRVWYAGRMLNHAWQPEWRLRLVRTGKARWGGYDPHDKLEPIETGANTKRLAGVMRHDAMPTLGAFLHRQIEHARIAAESYEQLNKRTSAAKLVTSPVGAWARQMILRSAWRDGWRGCVASGATAFAAFAKHAELLERTRARGGDK